MIKLKLIAAMAVSILLSGCAMTTYDLPVNYSYAGNIDTVRGENLPTVNIGSIKDVRAVENPRMIMNHKSGYGTTATGGYQAEKNISLIIEDALRQGIETAGLDSERSRHVLLEGELVDINSDIVQGWWKGTINMKVTVKLSVREEGYNEILWRDTIIGHGISSKQSSVKPALLEALNSAMNELADNLISDEYFQQKVLN